MVFASTHLYESEYGLNRRAQSKSVRDRLRLVSYMSLFQALQ